MAVYLGNNKITFDGISEIYVGSNKVYSAAPPDYSTEYFFVENLTNSNNTLNLKPLDYTTSFNISTYAPEITVYYSLDKNTWQSGVVGGSRSRTITYTIPANSKVYLKATTTAWGYEANTSTGGSNRIFCSDGDFSVGGNIMSLLYGDNFIGQTTLSTAFSFSDLLRSAYSSSLTDIDRLVLPATTITDYCYFQMFKGCTGLTSIPSTLLPATTLTNYCYSSMFESCTGLTSIPSTLLPATTLAAGCYAGMFSGCKGLTSIPSTLLPATTLTNYCYSSMFSGCKGLTSIPSNLLQATTLSQSCYYGMFSGCKGLTSIPSDLLPATTLADYCYFQMFKGCTGITSIPSNLLQATTLSQSCYWGIFESCTGLTTIPSTLLQATTLAQACYYQMFRGCTSITTAPNLPARTLENYCYYQMFYNCSNLNEITCAANDISASRCTYQWVNGVAASGTFHKRGDAAWTTGIDGIPTGWTVIDERPYNPINDYFWVENRKSSSDTIQFTFITNLTSSKFSPTLSSSSNFFYYSTDKSTWTPHTASNLTIPANTRYYFYCNRSEGSYPQSGSVSSGKAYPYFKSFGGIMAAAKINGSFQPTLFANLGFGGNASSNFAIGGNIRTLLGKGTGGVGDTSLLERGWKSSLMIDSSNQCRYIGYTALGTASTSFSNSQNDIGLFFTGITDAGNLYIGNSDHEAEFSLITPTTLPIYT